MGIYLGIYTKTYKNLYSNICSYENLELAFNRAKKRKTRKSYVIEFESKLEYNLKELKYELDTLTYSPVPLTTFVVRDPKTRRISASQFRDRVVHHALCNIIVPIFEKNFIYDSFANQKNKGTHAAIKRFEGFLNKINIRSKHNGGRGERQKKLFPLKIIRGYALKADIRHYFDTIDHEVLLEIIERKIKDRKVISLIKLILRNHKLETIGKGMPLGNLTSQFFANMYLNELDQFVKHKLKIKYYLRYVDDFVILHKDRKTLEKWKIEIDNFLHNNLKIELHKDKTKIYPVSQGTTLLGFRIFYKYRLLKRSNARRIWKRIEKFKLKYENGEMSIEEINASLQGWIAYAKFANTYSLRKKVSKRFDKYWI